MNSHLDSDRDLAEHLVNVEDYIARCITDAGQGEIDRIRISQYENRIREYRLKIIGDLGPVQMDVNGNLKPSEKIPQ